MKWKEPKPTAVRLNADVTPKTSGSIIPLDTGRYLLGVLVSVHCPVAMPIETCKREFLTVLLPKLEAEVQAIRELMAEDADCAAAETAAGI